MLNITVSSATENGGADKPTQDLLLLLSLLLLILLHPVLAEEHLTRLLLGALTFAPLIVATIRISHKKELLWPLVALICAAVISSVGAYTSGSRTLLVIQWAVLTAAFVLAVSGLFAYLQRAGAITAGHLYTAASNYLLLTLSFFALYMAIVAVHPDAFQKAGGNPTHPPADLLYFSLVTLTTVGYGDVVPVRGTVRMIAGLEAATGVLYVAITVAQLVSGYTARRT